MLFQKIPEVRWHEITNKILFLHVLTNQSQKQQRVPVVAISFPKLELVVKEDEIYSLMKIKMPFLEPIQKIYSIPVLNFMQYCRVRYSSTLTTKLQQFCLN